MSGGLTWAQLRDVRCAELEGAADGWGKASNRADAARDRIDKQLLAGLTGSQEGEAARAAVGRLRALGRNLSYIYTECGLVRTTLNSLAQDLRGSQRQLRDALEEAAGLRLTVQTDGSVSYPEAGEDPITKEKLRGGTASGHAYLRSAPPPGFTSPNPLAAKAQAIADRIARALSEAAETDARYTEALRKLVARDGDGLKVTDAMWADASADAAAVRALTADYLRDAVPLAAPPAERLAWWRGLTPEQREEYLAVHPDLIGNLDGIPSAVRDAANRDNLTLLMGKLEGADDDRSRTMLAGLRSIDGQLRAGGHPPMFLLGIGDEGNGRAIVSYGNPDAARNVSAYVPGLGTGLDEGFAEDDLKRARDTLLGSLEYDRSTASIVWLGYDAPQLSVDDITGNTDVMFTDHAEAGASAYGEFMAGIAATNEHDDPHMTAVGHSYGSLTVGQAAQRDGGIPGVDDIVLVGSPGTGANSADDLGVGSGHVYVGAAENDPVTRAPSKAEAQGLGMGALGGASVGAALGGPVGAAVGGAGGAAMAYFAQDAQTPESGIWFGTDPAHEDFGARRFRVDDGPHPLLDMGGVKAHSNYFDPGKDVTSADNIARIVVGDYREVQLDRHRRG